MGNSNLDIEYDTMVDLYLIYQRDVKGNRTNIIGSLYRDTDFRAINKGERKDRYQKLRVLHQTNQVWIFDSNQDIQLFEADLQIILENLKVLNKKKEV